MAEFRFHSPRRDSRRRRLLVATAVVLVIFAIDLVSGGSLRSIVRVSFSGIWNATAHVREAVLGSGYFSSHRALASENARLRNEIAQLQEDTAALTLVRAQNTQLSSMTHLASDQPGLTAPVVSSMSASPYGTFLVGAGSRDGVVPDSLVLTADGFVLGRVSEVHAGQSLVTSVLESGTQTESLIGGIAVTVEGRGGGNGRAALPRSAVVATGTPVIAPSLSARPIGIVGHIDSNPTSAESTAYVVFPVNLSTLQYVFIVTPRT
jgi:cell shape-determining protein MreC